MYTSKKLLLNNVTLIGITDTEVYGLSVAQEICQKNIDFHSVKLITSNKTNKYPNLVHIDEYINYESFMRFKVEKLNNYIETDFALLCEPDGFVLDATLWSDDFFEYDYIGAVMERDVTKGIVGNSGFCLQSKKFRDSVQQILKTIPFENLNVAPSLKYSNDVWSCITVKPILEEMGCRFVTPEIANKFSITKDIWDSNSFGFHGFRTDISRWLLKNNNYRVNKNRNSIIRG